MAKKYNMSEIVAELIGGSLGQIAKGFLIATGAIMAIKLFLN